MYNMSLSSNNFFYTNTNHNDASNVLINYNNLTGNSDLIQHPFSKYSKLLFFSPTYNIDLFNAINWANSLGIYKEQHNLVNPLVNNVLISQPFVSSVIEYRDIVQKVQIGSPIDGIDVNDENGHSVSISDDGLIMAVSARNFSGDNPNSNIGHVRIYEWYDNNWLQIGSDIIGENDNEKIGNSISLNANGNMIAIGISEYNSGDGGVRIYQNINNIWTKIGELNGYNDSTGDVYDVALSSDGKIVAYGSYMNENVKGRVDIYKYVNNTWQSMGYILGILAGEMFGGRIALSADGNILAASAPMNSGNGTNRGQVRVYEYSNNTWEQIGTINGESDNDYSGGSLSLNAAGNILAIGSMNNNDNDTNETRGHVRVYKHTKGKYNDDWKQLGYDIDGEFVNSMFGNSVSLSNDGYLLAIGAKNSVTHVATSYGTDNFSNIGDVNIYQYLSDVVNDKWVKMGLDITGQNKEDCFGSSVALSGNGHILVVGAEYSECYDTPTVTKRGRVRAFELIGSVQPITPLQTKITNISRIGNYIDGTEKNERLGTRFSISDDGTTVILGFPELGRGEARVYEWVNDGWQRKGSSVYGRGNGHQVGTDIAINENGSIFAVCSVQEGGKVYEWNSSSWQQKGSNLRDGEFNSATYTSKVALNGDGTVVAFSDSYKSNGSDTYTGYVLVYKWNGTDWENKGSIIRGFEANARFGGQLKINKDGNILIASGTNYGSSAGYRSGGGYIEIFKYNDENEEWEQLGETLYGITSNGLGNDLSLSSDGYTFATSIYQNAYGLGIRAVQVYKWNNKDWVEKGNSILGFDNNGSFGQRVSLNGDGTMLAIGDSSSRTWAGLTYGSPGSRNPGGAFYMYQYNSTTGYNGIWERVYTLGRADGMNFATEVEISKNGTKILSSLPEYDGAVAHNSVGRLETYEIIQTTDTDISSNIFDSSYSIFHIEQVIDTVEPKTRFGQCVEISSDGKIMAVSAPWATPSNVTGYYRGVITVYELIDDSWKQKGDVIYGSNENRDYMGKSLALSSNGLILAIGSPNTPYNGNYRGETKIYRWNNSWTQMGSTIKGDWINQSAIDNGTSVSLSASGLILAVGSPKFYAGGAGAQGRVNVYEFKNNVWENMPGSPMTGQHVNNRLGNCVALSGDGMTMAAGAPYFDNNDTTDTIGRIRIYKYSNNYWHHSGDIDGLNETPSINYTYDVLGDQESSISLNYDGTIIAFGSRRNSVNGKNSGCVRVYDYKPIRDPTPRWAQLGSSIRGGYNPDYGSTGGDFFGWCVSLSYDGLTVAIGSPQHSNPDYGKFLGCARVYKYIDNDWNMIVPKIDPILPSYKGDTTKHYFGKSIALSGDSSTLIVGAPYEPGDFDGYAYGYICSYNLVHQSLKNENFNILKFGSDINGKNINANCGYSVSLSGSGLIMAIGSSKGTHATKNSPGYVEIYKWSNNDWNQIGTIYGEDYEDFGRSISLSNDGKIVAIGAVFNDSNGYNDSGCARIYEYDNNDDQWKQLGSDINGETNNENFGWSVSLSANGKIVAISSPYSNSNKGRVCIYDYVEGRSPKEWKQIGDTIDGEATSDYSGYSVSLNSDGTIVAIGSYRATDNNYGSVNVYKWSDTSWNIMGSSITGKAYNQRLGHCVTLSSDGFIIAIASHFPYNKGSVNVYQWSNNEWINMGYDLNMECDGSRYTKYIALNDDGNILAIGSSGYNYNGSNIDSGRVQVYKFYENNWIQIGKNIYGDVAYDLAGSSISLNGKGNILCVGSRNVNANNLNNSGRVRTYEIVQ